MQEGVLHKEAAGIFFFLLPPQYSLMQRPHRLKRRTRHSQNVARSQKQTETLLQLELKTELNISVKITRGETTKVKNMKAESLPVRDVWVGVSKHTELV